MPTLNEINLTTQYSPTEGMAYVTLRGSDVPPIKIHFPPEDGEPMIQFPFNPSKASMTVKTVFDIARLLLGASRVSSEIYEMRKKEGI